MALALSYIEIVAPKLGFICSASICPVANLCPSGTTAAPQGGPCGWRDTNRPAPHGRGHGAPPRRSCWAAVLDWHRLGRGARDVRTADCVGAGQRGGPTRASPIGAPVEWLGGIQAKP